MRDLALGVDGDLTVTEDLALITGAQGIAQSIRIAFNFERGEWFLDPRVGTPMFDRILGQRPDFGIIRATVRDVLLSRPGVTRVDSIDIALDTNRRLTIKWAVVVDGITDVVFGTETLILDDTNIQTQRAE